MVKTVYLFYIFLKAPTSPIYLKYLVTAASTYHYWMKTTQSPICGHCKYPGAEEPTLLVLPYNRIRSTFNQSVAATHHHIHPSFLPNKRSMTVGGRLGRYGDRPRSGLPNLELRDDNSADDDDGRELELYQPSVTLLLWIIVSLSFKICVWNWWVADLLSFWEQLAEIGVMMILRVTYDCCLFISMN